MTEEQIIAVLRRYRVQRLYRATTAAGATRYAVFRDGAAVTDPQPHRAAEEARERLIARDLLE